MPAGRSGARAAGYVSGTVLALRHAGCALLGLGDQLCDCGALMTAARPAQYHLLALPDGSCETVSCLASVIRCGATAPTVILDVSAVERLSIDALAVLVRKAMRLQSVGGELLLAGPCPAVRKVIERTGTGPLLPVFADTTAAVRALTDDGRTWRRLELTAGRGALFAEPPSPPPSL